MEPPLKGKVPYFWSTNTCVIRRVTCLQLIPRCSAQQRLRACGLKDRNQFCILAVQSHGFCVHHKEQMWVQELACTHGSALIYFYYSNSQGNQPAEVSDSALVLSFYTHYLLISCVSKTVALRRVLFHSKPRLKMLTFPLLPLTHPHYTLLSHYLQIILFTELSQGKKRLFSRLTSLLSMLSNAVRCCDVTRNITTCGLVFINSPWFP